MSRSYTNLIQTGRANINVEDTYGPTGDAQSLFFVDSNVYSIQSGNVIFIYNRIDNAGNVVSFSTSTLGNLTLPVDITGNYNKPVYLDGTDVAANKCWPYYQNTASTTDGWDANSTAMFEPYQAAFFASTNSTNNWYKILQSNVSANIPNGFSRAYFATSSLQMVSNADTNVQYMTFFTSSLNANVLVASSMTLDTIELKANCPIRTGQFYGYELTGNYSILSLGIIVRNMSSNTRVYFTAGSLSPTYQF